MMKLICLRRTIRDQSPGLCMLVPREYGRHSVPNREIGNLYPLTGEHLIRQYDKSADRWLGYRRECAFELLGVPHIDVLELDVQRTGRRLGLFELEIGARVGW